MAAATTTSIASNVLDAQTQRDFSWFKYNMDAELTQVLLNALSNDGNVREHAEESLKQRQEQDLPGFLLSLSGELANDERPMDSRRLAGLILKKKLHRRWLFLDNNVKSQVQKNLLKTCSSPVSDARSTVSQIIAKVAGIELRKGWWPELVRSLLSKFCQSPADVRQATLAAHVRQATLETLGYLCKEVSPDHIDQDHVNEIVRAVLWGMDFYGGNNDVRLAATRALSNVLGLAQARFNDDMERDNIMRVVCEATDSPDVRIRQAAFECLVSISSTYYDKLDPYFWDILYITDEAVRQGVEPVALKAIEFWSSICYKEIEILEEHGVPFFFIQRARHTLLYMLIETLVNQEGIISMAGGRCLGLVARTVGDDIVSLVRSFVEENITQPDRRQRQAVTYALWFFLEGTPLAQLASIITQDNWQQIIRVVLDCMQDAPNVVEKACRVISFLAQHSQYFPYILFYPRRLREIMDALGPVIYREDAGESRLRTVARCALFELFGLPED